MVAAGDTSWCGIMLAFMWNITQSVPDSAITTKITVKIVDSSVQPASTLLLMCRK
ncbi:hypothetical protein D3C71_2127450 [compost metagenome]